MSLPNRHASSLLLCFTLLLFQLTHGYRVNFGSCNDANKSQPLWPHVLERKPDLWVWGGDNIYADTRPRGVSGFVDAFMNDREELLKTFPKPPFRGATKEVFAHLYGKQQSDAGYKALVDYLSHENVIGIWDDHDFGLNDAGKGYELKEFAQQAFLDFFHVPMDSKRRARQGIYSFTDRDEGRLRVIMLDNRYHKDDYSVVDGDFLGEEQWAWLEETLATSTAKVNVVVSGLQVFPDLVINNAIECWNLLPVSRTRLLKTITESKAQGVILVSGDVHFSEMMQAVCTCKDSGTQYSIPEVTASGLTHSWGTVPVVLSYLLTMVLYNIPNTWRIDNLIYFGLNFGEFDFELEGDHPTVDTSIFGIGGEKHLSKKWDLRELKQSNQTDCTCEGVKGKRRPASECYAVLFLCLSCYLFPYICLYYATKFVFFSPKK